MFDLLVSHVGIFPSRLIVGEKKNKKIKKNVEHMQAPQFFPIIKRVLSMYEEKKSWKEINIGLFLDFEMSMSCWSYNKV